ncbi:MAG TPA: helix-turn-helix transcriptional regulator [Candidatus Limnocylindrales bacterium]|jgi:DNA-binding XRE family transcriptional regulator
MVVGRRGQHPVDQWAAEVLGRWLYDWRARTGVSQRRLARLAGIDQGGLSRIEHGKGRPSGFRLARLIIALDWLSGGGVPAGPWEALDLDRPWRIDERGPRPPAVVGFPVRADGLGPDDGPPR